MKALFMKPAEQLIEPIEANGQNDIIKLIGYESVIADDVGSNEDVSLADLQTDRGSHIPYKMFKICIRCYL